jgi:DNA-binding transcriptional regulator YhcF (GntR family)
MPVRPTRFDDLATQVADHLRKQIELGHWQDWLPGERALAEELQVSRKTMRSALLILEQARCIQTIPSRGHKVTGSMPATPVLPDHGSLPLAILMREPINDLRPFGGLWITHLQTLLHDASITVRRIVAPRCYVRRPGAALKRTIEQHPSSCWILSHSTTEMQRWFQQAGLPCVVAGSVDNSVSLPDVDLDHYALCRHAAGVLVRAGHRDIALVIENTHRGGDFESERGFMDGCARSGRPGLRPCLMQHEKTVESVTNGLDRLLRQARPPTALCITQPTAYLTAVSYFGQHRLRIPQDISILCRGSDTFLEHLIPLPSRYYCPPQRFARHMARQILQSTQGRPLTKPNIRIMPTYVPGRSVQTLEA